MEVKQSKLSQGHLMIRSAWYVNENQVTIQFYQQYERSNADVVDKANMTRAELLASLRSDMVGLAQGNSANRVAHLQPFLKTELPDHFMEHVSVTREEAKKKKGHLLGLELDGNILLKEVAEKNGKLIPDMEISISETTDFAVIKKVFAKVFKEKGEDGAMEWLRINQIKRIDAKGNFLFAGNEPIFRYTDLVPVGILDHEFINYTHQVDPTWDFDDEEIPFVMTREEARNTTEKVAEKTTEPQTITPPETAQPV